MTNVATILIADGDAGFITRIVDVLKGQGYEVQEAGGGPQVLQALNAHHFDLVILDLFIPLLDGIETLKLIKQIDQTLPVLVLSADEKLEKVAEAIRCGAYDYLIKPLDGERLTITVRNALMTRRLQKEVMVLQQQMREHENFGNGNGEALLSAHFQEALTTTTMPGNADLKAIAPLSRQIIPLREVEKALLRRALKIANYNMSSAASSLGIGRTTLYRKLHKYQIPLPR